MRTLHGRRSIADFKYSPLAAALAVALAPQAAQATSIVVNYTTDTNPGVYLDSEVGTNLRGAIAFVNANCTGTDKITFFSSNGPFITTVASNLPTITCGGLTIDGAGTMNNPGAIVQPSYGGGNGLFANTSTPVTVKGMGISGFDTGLSGHLVADNNKISNNGTGIDSSFADNKITNNAIFSGSTGIWISYGGQVITGNHIYDNGTGIDVEEVTSASISNNVIGIDGEGDNCVGIFSYGNKITISGNTIGSSQCIAMAIEGDLGSTISSNTIGIDPSTGNAFHNAWGIDLYQSTGTTVSNNLVSNTYGGAVSVEYGANITLSNNKLGTDSTGTEYAGNYNGIEADCSSNVSVQGNIIVNSPFYGGLTGVGFYGVTGGGSLDIVNNKISVAGDGITPLGTMAYGIIVSDSDGVCGSTTTTQSLALKSSRASVNKSHVKHARVKTKAVTLSTAGGPSTNVMISGNKILYVNDDGIQFNGGFNSTVTGNTIMYGGGYGVNVVFGNGIKITDNPKIYGNGSTLEGGQKNVSLVPGDVYHNPSGVVQPTVPNDGMDAPAITAVTRNYTNNTTLVEFSFNGQPGSYLVQLCQNNPASIVPGCSQVMGQKTVQITSGTSVSDSISVLSVVADFFSANVTNLATKDTSEFSDVVKLTAMPAATYSPPSHDFGNVGVGSASAPFTFTISSTGSTPLIIGSLKSPDCEEGEEMCSSGWFSCQSTCNVGTDNNPGYNPGKTCTITATFMPQGVGPAPTTTIGVCDNTLYGGTFTLNGMGVTAAPVTVSPNVWDFGSQALRTQGPKETFTITNPTTASVSIGTPVTSAADFVLTSNSCPSSIAPGGNCDVDVAFNPQSAGLITGTLSVPSGAAPGLLQVKRVIRGRNKASAAPEGPSATASLQGTGTVTAALTLPSTLDLGTYTSGDPANAKTITVTNTGNAVLSISSVTATGPFSVLNGCPANLQPDASCGITVSYSAADLGTHTGNLLILSNADPGAHNTSLTATTVASPTPRITVTPAQIGFGDRFLGTQSPTQRITITNIGNAPATLSTGVTTPDFLVATSNCTAVLAPATSCFADVVLRPVGFGPRVGTFQVDSNAQGSPFAVKLSGSGCRPYSAGSSRLGSSFSCAP